MINSGVDCEGWIQLHTEKDKTIYVHLVKDTAPFPQPKKRWIPVDKKLPEPNQMVGKVRKYYLVQDKYGDMFVASYNKTDLGLTYWEEMYDLDEVVAWMELPDPYRKETSDDIHD